MPGLLERFRKLAPPGATLPGGAVPIDPREAAAAELAPIFAAAADAGREAAARSATAHEHADRLRDEASAAAAAALEKASADAVRARAEAAGRVRTEQAAARGALLTAAEHRVEMIERDAQRERGQRVAAVVERVRRIAGEAPPS